MAHTPVDGKEGVPDVCVIELGGTVGDIESMPFVEALRQFQVGRWGPCERGHAWQRSSEGMEGLLRGWGELGASWECSELRCIHSVAAALPAPHLVWFTWPRPCTQFRVGPENICNVHVSLVPVIGVVGEQKTKPTQHSVQVGQGGYRGCASSANSGDMDRA